MSKEKKPFGETKVGLLLKNVGSPILDIVGTVIPSVGLLSNVIDAVTKDPKIPAADKAAIVAELNKELELAELEVRDRESARSRQVDMAKAGKSDWLHNLVGVFGLLIFGFIAYVVVFVDVPEKNSPLFHNLLGLIEGVVLSIFGFYFGSSKSSHEKTKLLGK